MSLPSLSDAAGSVGKYLFAVVSSTSIYKFTTNTPGTRIVTLRELLNRIKIESSDVDKLLERIPKERLREDPALTNQDKKNFLLTQFSARLTQLENQVASAGMWKWFPLYLDSEIVILGAELVKAHDNIVRTTEAANGILAQLLEAPNAECLWAENPQKGGKAVRGTRNVDISGSET